MAPSLFVLSAAIAAGLFASESVATTSTSRQHIYEDRHIDCRSFKVGIDGDLEVWFSASSGKEIAAFFYIINRGSLPIEVLPGGITSEAIRVRKKGGLAHSALRIYTADAYQEIQRRRSFRRGSITTSGAISMENKPPGHAGDQTLVRSSVKATPQGMVIVPAHIAPQSQPPKPTNQSTVGPKPGAYQAPPPAAFPGASLRFYEDILLRRQTLQAGASGGGVVYIRAQPADSYRITFPLGSSRFEFEVWPPHAP